jgi:NAD(P)-dependent dehydrogenase (short-subunit alcohol dehydrogenase family)
MTQSPGSSERPDWPLAIVFGAGGLGMAVARQLGLSHRLLIADRDQEHLHEQIARLTDAGHDAKGLACDVTKVEDIARLAKMARQIGGVRALAYVVGLSPSLGDFASIMAVNLAGPARVLAAFLDVMVPGGAALCVSSSAAHMQPAPPDLLPLLDRPLQEDLIPALSAALGAGARPAMAYTLSKQALVRLCQREAGIWGRQGKRLVSLSPGLIATPQGAGEYRNSPGKMKLFESIPLARECTMLEIAGIADFLLSDKASYINGVDLLVDGGLIAALGCRPFA